jgi:hypothetical protein
MPPVPIDFFPGEFRMRDIKHMSRLLNKHSTSLKVETSEPKAVMLDSAHGLTKTILPLSLWYQGAKSCPKAATLRVRSQLVGSTHISAVRMDKWTKNASQAQEIKTTAPEYTQEVDLLPQSWAREDNGWRQRMLLELPLFANQTPIPTFNTSFVSRRYSISLNIDVCSKANATFELKVPLQILYHDAAADDEPPSYAISRAGGAQQAPLIDQLPRYVR